MQICCVCGARPNFMKIAAVMRAFETHDSLRPFLVHTGQHYDERICMKPEPTSQWMTIQSY